MKLQLMRRSVVYEDFWRFSIERQSIMKRRLAGAPPPWTTDSILSQYRFTNVYRACDRVSQYLVRHVIYDGDQNPREIVFRTLLFKLFNRIGTWGLITEALGEPHYSPRMLSHISSILTRALKSGERIYSAAYIIPPLRGYRGRKHQGHLALLERMMRERIDRQLQTARSMEQAYRILWGYPMLGPFLAYQFLIDLNYSSVLRFSEMDFIVPGPGAIRGIAKCFPGYPAGREADIIRLVSEAQAAEFERRGAKGFGLYGRKMQLIDCQNVFCEVDKYARLAHPQIMSKDGRARIKQRYKPLTAPMQLWFPPKWGLNERVAREAYAAV